MSQRLVSRLWRVVGKEVEPDMTHIILHILQQTIFSFVRINNTRPFMLKHMPLSAIHTIASIRTSSHFFRCETRCWATCKQTHDMFIWPKQVSAFECHTLLEWVCFAHIFKPALITTHIPFYDNVLSQLQDLFHEILEHEESLMNPKYNVKMFHFDHIGLTWPHRKIIN